MKYRTLMLKNQRSQINHDDYKVLIKHFEKQLDISYRMLAKLFYVYHLPAYPNRYYLKHLLDQDKVYEVQAITHLCHAIDIAYNPITGVGDLTVPLYKHHPCPNYTIIERTAKPYCLIIYKSRKQAEGLKIIHCIPNYTYPRTKTAYLPHINEVVYKAIKWYNKNQQEDKTKVLVKRADRMGNCVYRDYREIQAAIHMEVYRQLNYNN